MGASMACVGVFLLFQREILSVEIAHLYGLSLVALSTFFTLAGTFFAKSLLQTHKLPVFWVTSRAMFFGSFFFLLTLNLGNGMSGLVLETNFIFSLIYLAIVVTGGVMLLHSYMVKHYGAATASFLWTIVPPSCLLFSAFFEGYIWVMTTTLGFLFIILGATLNHAYPTLVQRYRQKRA